MLVIVSVTIKRATRISGRSTWENVMTRKLTTLMVPLACALAVAASAPAFAEGDCKPGKTGKIAFMLKHQKAFRYLNADVPFFVKTAEAGGYQVLVQSADHDAAKQVAQAENVITQGVDAIIIQPVDFNVAASIAEKANEAGIPIAS
ncbi:MAG: substrate-binding domain-containing protein, partial [Alphaproteobacteria bacterium]